MIKKFFEKYAAYVIAAVLFIALSYIYCSPVLKGKVLHTADGENAAAAIHANIEYTAQTGDYSWWTPSVFSGMPAYLIGGGEYKSEKWLSPIMSILHKGYWNTPWILILYFFCFFILLLSFGIDKWLSIIGAIAIALSSYFIVIIAAGHNTKTASIALISVVVGGFYLIFRKKYGIGFVLAMIFTAAGFSCHPQMTYYLFMMIGLMWLAELAIHIKEHSIKDFCLSTATFALSITIGLGTGCSNILANREYAAESIRSGSELAAYGTYEDEGTSIDDGLSLKQATAWSYGLDETFSLLIPGIKGGANAIDLNSKSRLYKDLISHDVKVSSAKDFCNDAPMYWGTQPSTAGNVYVGSIICFLFILGLILVNGPYKWALLAATLFSIILSWGSNCLWFTKLFFNYFPLYNKFRAVSSILIVAEIAIPLLGFLCLKDILSGNLDKKRVARGIWISTGITISICLFFAVFCGMIYDFHFHRDSLWNENSPEWLINAVYDQRETILRLDSIRSILFISGAAGILFLFLKGKLKRIFAIGALGILISVDLWSVDKRYLNDNDFVSPNKHTSSFQMAEWEEQLRQDKSLGFRVWNLSTDPYNDERTSLYYNSIGGYHAAKLKRYQDLIDVHLKKGHMPVANMLNAQYIIIKNEDGSPALRSNPYACGPAWWVSNIRMVDGAREEIDALMEENLYTTAIVDKSFDDYIATTHPDKEDNASVKVLDYNAKSVEYESISNRDGVIVFSEIYYPHGWKATIDGKPAYYFRANYALRAMTVPSGRHIIRFVFDPSSVKIGDTIAIIFILLMYLSTAGIACYALIRKYKKGRSAI